MNSRQVSTFLGAVQIRALSTSDSRRSNEEWLLRVITHTRSELKKLLISRTAQMMMQGCACLALLSALSTSALAQGAAPLHGAGGRSGAPVRVATPVGHINRSAPTGLSRGVRNLMTPQGMADKARSERGQLPSGTKPLATTFSGAPATPALSSPSAPSPGNFNGIGDTGWIPPDGALAAGPYNVVHAVNESIAIYNKVGTLQYQDSINNFLCCGAANGGDPHVVYNPYVGRFFFASIGNNSAKNYYLAVSNDNDATHGWTYYTVDIGDTVGNVWCDYPELAFNAVATFVTCNMYDFSNNFSTAAVTTFNSSQVAAEGGIEWWINWGFHEGFFNLFSSFTMQPAREYGAGGSTGEFLVDAQGGGGSGSTLSVWRETNELNCCGSVQSSPSFASTGYGVGGYSSPPSAPQPFGVLNIDTGDARLLGAFWQGGLLTTYQNTTDSGVASLAATQLNVSSYPSISTVFDWQIGSGGTDARYYPAVDANNSGNMLMVYSHSSTGVYAEAQQFGIFSNGSIDGVDDGFHSGNGTYRRIDTNRCPGTTITANCNRWGDYFTASRDPDGTGIWGEAEYVSSTNAWGNAIGLFYDSTFVAPTLTSLSPQYVSPNAPFTLFAFGYNFTTDAYIVFNNLGRSTTFWSGQELSTNLAASDVPASGVYPVYVFNPSHPGSSNTLNVYVSPVATDDNYLNAITFNTPYATAENTTGATVQSTDPSPCGYFLGNSHSVWFKYTPTVSGTLTLSTAGSNYDTVLSAYTGSPGAFTNVACDDDFNFTLQSQISFHVTAGTPYSIEVQSYDSSAGGFLNFAAVFDPDNDSWSSRINVGAPTYHAAAEDTTQTITGGEDPAAPCGAGSFNSHSVWFNYTPTASGMVFASAQGSNYDTVISVYTGSPGVFVSQACNDDFYGFQSMTPFYALAGTPYSIMVQSFSSSAGGNLLLTMNKQDLVPTPSSAAFTTKQPIGTTSAAKTITIKNQNSNTVHINSVTASANFGLTTNTCTGANIAPGGSCSLGVVFSPTNPGALKGSITVSSGANNYSLVINASGTAVYPLDFTVASVSFPLTAVGTTSAQKLATLTNYTSAPIPLGTRTVSADFNSSDNCGTSLAAHASCTFTVSFTPNRPVATTGVVTLAATTSPQPIYLGLTGTGSGSVTTHVTVTASLSFANTFIGLTSASKTATLKNTGTTAITINGFSVAGPFNVTGGTCTTLAGGVLSPGLSCTYIATFTPNAVSAFKGALVIRDTDPTARQIVALVGNGIPAVTFSKTSLTFGSVLVGRTSATQTVTITNNTSAGISSFGLALSGDYGLSSTDCPTGGTLAAHAVCHATLYFQPITQGGIIGGSLAVSGSQLGTPQLLGLTGTGN
jgi:uncharacterized protein DUF1573